MKRLWLITYEYPPIGGGTGKVVRNTARHLVRRGFEVLVLTSRYRDQPEDETDPAGFRIRRIPVRRERPNQANAVEVMSFAASGVWRAGSLLASLPKPYLTLAYFTLPCGAVSWELRRRAGIPYFTLLRGQDVPGHPEASPLLHTLARPAVRAVWRGSERIVANSRGLAEMAERAAPPKPVDVAPNGVDLEIFCPGPAPPPAADGAGRDSRPFRVAYVGRLTRGKGLRELIEAMARVRESQAGLTPGPEPELVLAGVGPDEEELRRRVHEFGLQAAVTFLGRVDEQGVVELLRSADLFVNPSHGEGMPAALLEAMAVGAPALASEIPPHREILEGGFGLLFRTGDAGDLARRIDEAIRFPEMRRGLAAAGRRHIIDNYGWEAAVDRLVSLFPPSPSRRLIV